MLFRKAEARKDCPGEEVKAHGLPELSLGTAHNLICSPRNTKRTLYQDYVDFNALMARMLAIAAVGFLAFVTTSADIINTEFASWSARGSDEDLFKFVTVRANFSYAIQMQWHTNR